MAFSVISKKSGKTYFLHERKQELKGGQKVTLYYFGGEAKEGAIDALPAGYEVSENTKTGLPLLKKTEVAQHVQFRAFPGGAESYSGRQFAFPVQ